jgi:hypothetical protein
MDGLAEAEQPLLAILHAALPPSAFAALGGIGYASSAANSAFHVSKIERLVAISHHSSHNDPIQGGGTANNPTSVSLRQGLRRQESRAPARERVQEDALALISACAKGPDVSGPSRADAATAHRTEIGRTAH